MKSFTLLELIVVVVLLSILAGIAMPTYVRLVSRARESEGWTFLTAIRSSELRYYNENEEIFTSNLNELDLDATSTLLFSYRVRPGLPPSATPSFTAVAAPNLAACPGCHKLCLDNSGNKGEEAACP